jgi:potassium-dependent mechanosensitive channel
MRGWCLVLVLLASHGTLPPQGVLAQSLLPKGIFAAGDEAAPSPPVETVSGDDVKERLRIAQRTLEAAKSAAQEGEKPPAELTREVSLLQQLKSVQSQLAAAGDRKRELETARDELAANLKVAATGEPIEKPESEYLHLEQLRDQLAAEEARATANQADLTSANDAVERAKATLAEKERLRRVAKEALDASKDSTDEAEKARLARAHEISQLESQIAEATAQLREAEAANEKLAAENQQTELRLLKVRVDLWTNRATFREQDLSTLISQIDQREAELREQAETVQADSEYPERQWQAAMERRSQQGRTEDAVLDAEIEAWRRAREAQRARAASINEQLAQLAKARIAWNRRYEIAAGDADATELVAWRKETRQAIEDVNTAERSKTARAGQLRTELAQLDERMQAARQTPDAAARWIGEQREHVAELVEILGTTMVNLETSRRLHEKLLADIEGDGESKGVAAWLATAWSRVTAIWNHELTSVDDRPITTGKILSGVILLLLGFFFSRWLSGFLGRRLMARFHVTEGAAAAMQTISFYVLVVTFALFALRLVNVPLTAFTILGGALAVGVGFGSQNIVNNFFSGLILLAERPVRVGDVVEIGSGTASAVVGTVQKIGARSTWIRTGTNFEIIVPNSSLVQNNVVNWTLTDDKIRTSIRVGVAYGSSTRDVSRLLKKAADDHGLAMNNPEPFVLFTDFGDNSLVFVLHFWLQMRSLSERLRIESDIRHIIDQRFREAGIVMAFPQRDVHLDVSGPVDVRFVDRDASRSEAA